MMKLKRCAQVPRVSSRKNFLLHAKYSSVAPLSAVPPVPQPPTREEPDLPASAYMKDIVKNHVKIEDEDYFPLRLHGATPEDLFKPSRFSVTDLTAQYCELRSFYDMISTKPREISKQMTRGTDIHKALELRVNKQYEVPDLEDKTPEDEWGHKLLLASSRLNQLITNGYSRELYVMGYIRGKLVTGYIDAVEQIDGGDRVMIIDSKSRSNNTLPPVSQRISAYHQLLIYRQLMHEMAELDISRVCTKLGLDEHKPLNRELVNVMGYRCERGSGTNGSSDPVSLRHVLSTIKLQLKRLTLSDQLEVEYIRTRGRGKNKVVEKIGTIRYAYDQSTFDQVIDFSYSFWDGTRDPLGVSSYEYGTKCRSCKLAPKCSWREAIESA